MKITSIKISNFRQYYGTTIVDFAIDKSFPLTVIHGINGAGKTAFLNAFSWGLYGKHKLPMDEPNYNNRTFDDTAIGENISVSVELMFEHDNKNYHLIRSENFKKNTERTVAPLARNTSIDLTETDISGRNRRINNPEDCIKQILPEDMQPYFFFDGEDINRLGDTTSSSYAQKIKKAIKNLMDITIVEQGIKHLAGASRRIKREIEQTGTDESREISHKITNCETTIDDFATKRKNSESEMDCLNEQIHAIDDRLKAIEPAKNLQNRREQISQEITRRKRELIRLEKECRIKLQQMAPLPFLSQVIEKTTLILDQNHERGVLPSGIRETFINDLLEQKRCICDRPLEPNDAAYVAVSSLLARQAGAAEIEEKVALLRGYIAGVDEGCTSLSSDLSSYISRRNEISGEIIEYETQLSEIAAKIKQLTTNGSSEDPAALEEKRDELRRDLRIATDSIAIATTKIKDLERLKEDLSRKLIKAKGLASKAQLATKRYETIQRVSEALKSLNNILISKVKDDVSEEIKSILDKVTDQYLYGEVTEDFELKTFKKDNGRLVPIGQSTGQRQVTSLAFITSLVKIARDHKIQEQQNKFMRGGEYPIVMDAPFNSVDPIFGPKIANLMPQLTPQIILFTNPQQWHGGIEGVLRQYVGKEYVITFHKNDVSLEQNISLPRGEYPLLTKIDGCQFSSITEVR